MGVKKIQLRMIISDEISVDATEDHFLPAHTKPHYPNDERALKAVYRGRTLPTLQKYIAVATHIIATNQKIRILSGGHMHHCYHHQQGRR